AGRGPFDDVVSAMLAQLLAQRGAVTRRIPHTFAARESVAQFDLSAVKVIIVCYLELAGAPAHLRYLVRRLRQRAPLAVVIAGLWTQSEGAATAAQIQKTLGADRYVASLREAVDASLAAPGNLPAAEDVGARIAPEIAVKVDATH